MSSTDVTASDTVLSRVLRRWWWLLVLAPVLGGLAGLVAARSAPAVYESQTRVLVGPVSGDFDTVRAAGQLTQTYAELVATDLVLGTVLDGLPEVAGITEDDVAVVSVPDTRIITITVSAGSAQDAAAVAGGLAQQLEQLAATREGDGSEGTVRRVAGPAVPEGPVAPATIVAALAALAALLLVAALAWLREGADDDTVRSAADLPITPATADLGTIALAGPAGGGDAASLLFLRQPDGSAANAYRALAARVEFADPGHPVRTVGVLCVGASAPAAEVAGNLALALAERSLPTALLDADGAGGQLTELFGLGAQPGLRDLLQGDAAAELAGMLRHRPEGVAVLPAGRAGDGARFPLAPAGELLRELDQEYRCSVLSIGATGTVDALFWGGLVDVVVLAVPARAARRHDVSHALHELQSVRAQLLGVVLLERRPRVRRGPGLRPPRAARAPGTAATARPVASPGPGTP